MYNQKVLKSDLERAAGRRYWPLQLSNLWWKMSLTLFSPAKINLFLRILGKRSDGYHALASLLQTLNFGDTLYFALAKHDHFTCSDQTLACDATNLVIKAVQLFKRKTGLHFSLKIHLDKKIPTQAGLGGGSSNAATTLWALNALHHKPYSDEELKEWSAEIGSDIPFFFSQGSAYCTGRGEQVRHLPLPTLDTFILLAKPLEGVSTPAVYKALCLDLCSKKDPEQILESFYTHTDPLFINDLEEPAFRLLPTLADYRKKLLDQGWPRVLMTGSGTCFFSPVAQLGNRISKHTPQFFIQRKHTHWYL